MRLHRIFYTATCCSYLRYPKTIPCAKTPACSASSGRSGPSRRSIIAADIETTNAALSQGLGRRLGLLHPALYAHTGTGLTPAGFRDITTGSNGAYTAGPGWDPCTGLGTPDGQALLTALHTG